MLKSYDLQLTVLYIKKCERIFYADIHNDKPVAYKSFSYLIELVILSLTTIKTVIDWKMYGLMSQATYED